MGRREQRARQTTIMLPHCDYEVLVPYVDTSMPSVRCWDCTCSMKFGLFATQQRSPRPLCTCCQEGFFSVLANRDHMFYKKGDAYGVS